MDGSSIYRVASNTKLLTSLGLLRQEAAGKLSLDHPISRYVAGLPNSASINWSIITIRILLSHLGGIPDNTSKRIPSSRRKLDFVPSLTWIFLHRRTIFSASHPLRPTRSPVCQSVRHSTTPSRVPKRVSGF